MFRGGGTAPPATGAASLTSGTIALNVGTAAAPSYSFAATTDGFYDVASGQLGCATSGAFTWKCGSSFGFQLRSDNYIGWATGNTDGLASDLTLFRDAANVLAQRNANSAQEFRVYAGNGGYSGIITVNESLTIAAAATTDSATTIPAGAIILGVSVRVTTVIPTAATFTVTAATGGNTFSTAAVAVAANTTNMGTAAGALYTSAGTKVRITPNLTPGAATGVVRLAIYYFAPTPPTS